MLEGDAFVSSPQIGSKGPDGFVSTTLDDESVEVTFTDKPTELTQVQVKAPTDSQPGDVVKVTVTYIYVDGKDRTRVSS